MNEDEILRKFKRQHTSTLLRIKRELHAAEHIRYQIVFQWRKPGGCPTGADRFDFRSWRDFETLDFQFFTRDQAQYFIDNTDIFAGKRHHRKVSCSIEVIKI